MFKDFFFGFSDGDASDGPPLESGLDDCSGGVDEHFKNYKERSRGFLT